MEQPAIARRTTNAVTNGEARQREIRAAALEKPGHYSVRTVHLGEDPRLEMLAVVIPEDAVCVHHDGPRLRTSAVALLPASGGRPRILRELQSVGYNACLERVCLKAESDTFKRRLVRALNEESLDGFYLLTRPPGCDENPRCNRARLVGSQVQVWSFFDEWLNVEPTAEFLSARTNRKICVELEPPRSLSRIGSKPQTQRPIVKTVPYVDHPESGAFYNLTAMPELTGDTQKALPVFSIGQTWGAWSGVGEPPPIGTPVRCKRPEDLGTGVVVGYFTESANAEGTVRYLGVVVQLDNVPERLQRQRQGKNVALETPTLQFGCEVEILEQTPSVSSPRLRPHSSPRP